MQYLDTLCSTFDTFDIFNLHFYIERGMETDINKNHEWYGIITVTGIFGCILIWKRSYWSFLHSHRIRIWCEKTKMLSILHVQLLLILHSAHVSVKVESCDPVITRPRLRCLVTSLVMGGEVVITVIRLGTCLPRPSRHLSEIWGHVRDVTRGQTLKNNKK